MLHKDVIYYPAFRVSLWLALAGAVTVAVCAAFWLHAVRGLDTKDSEVRRMAAELSSLQAEDQAMRLIARKRTAIAQLRRKLEAESDPGALMGHVQAVAEQSRVRVIEHKAPEQVEPGVRGNHLIRIEGDYAGVRRFLSELLSRSPNLVVVNRLSLARGQSGAFVSGELAVQVVSP